MVVRTAVEVEAGRAVVCRIAFGAEAEALRASADALGAAAGPGVVAVVRAEAVDGGWELVTEHGGLPVDAHRLRTASAVRAVGMGVARTLARVHALGLVHGGIEAEHVLVGSGGQPVLDGWGPDGGSPAGDVAALVGLLLRLADDLPPTTERRERAARAQLRQLLSTAGDDGTGPVPTAQRLAAALGAEPRAVGSATGPRRGRAVAAATAAVAVVVVLGGLRLGGSSGTGTAGGRSTSTTAIARPGERTSLPPCVVAKGTSSVSCPHAVVVEGAAVTVDGRRAVVGRVGDEVLVGDWGCEGAPRPAVLRPRTGEVLVFGPVDAPGGPGIALAERVEGATALAAALDGQGCPILLVVTPEGDLRLP